MPNTLEDAQTAFSNIDTSIDVYESEKNEITEYDVQVLMENHQLERNDILHGLRSWLPKLENLKTELSNFSDLSGNDKDTKEKLEEDVGKYIKQIKALIWWESNNSWNTSWNENTQTRQWWNNMSWNQSWWIRNSWNNMWNNLSMWSWNQPTHIQWFRSSTDMIKEGENQVAQTTIWFGSTNKKWVNNSVNITSNNALSWGQKWDYKAGISFVRDSSDSEKSRNRQKTRTINQNQREAEVKKQKLFTEAKMSWALASKIFATEQIINELSRITEYPHTISLPKIEDNGETLFEWYHKTFRTGFQLNMEKAKLESEFKILQQMSGNQ